MTLNDLGRRICIIGPSNSGKSTLAAAIGRSRGLEAVHLDRFAHFPNTNWRPRPKADFNVLHDATILGEDWVMDGNYSRCWPQRFARATGVILLDAPTPVSLLRYLRRSLFERERAGNLEGAKDSVNWPMIRHIAFVTPGNRRRYRQAFDDLELPKVSLLTPVEINNFYRSEGLQR